MCNKKGSKRINPKCLVRELCNIKILCGYELIFYSLILTRNLFQITADDIRNELHGKRDFILITVYIVKHLIYHYYGYIIVHLEVFLA